MRSEWLRGLPDEKAKKERKELVASARPTLDVLKEIVLTKLMDAESVQLSLADYDSPAWPYKQADRNAVVRTLRDILELLEP